MKLIKTLVLASAVILTAVLVTSCEKFDTDSESGKVHSEGMISSNYTPVKTDENSSNSASLPSGTVVSSEGFLENLETGEESGQNLNIDYTEDEQNALTETMSDEEILALDNTKMGWGQGSHTDSKNRPLSCLDAQSKYGEHGGLFIAEDSPMLYLTFDEGYENGYTAKILDVLKDKKVPAVFFVTTPYVKDNPDLIRRMIDEGHIVGNHSVRHKSMPELSIEEAADEIKGLHDYVLDEFGYEMTLFRPPMGEFSEQSMAVAKRLGYKTVLWSFAYKDWEVDNQPDEAASLEKLTQTAHNGAILLLHAVSETNANILAEYIDNMTEIGFAFSKLN